MDLVIKALADTNRRKVLEMLKSGDLTVTEIRADFTISGASMSHHLNILKRANLIHGRKQGQYVVYSLNMRAFTEAGAEIAGWFGKR